MASIAFRLPVLVLLLLASSRAAYSCTAFCLLDRGRPVIARNYDWHISDALVITNKRNVSKIALTWDQPAKWTSDYGSVTFNQYGREFPCGGMNEAGLVVTVLWLSETDYPRPDDRPSVSTSQWVQYQLDTSATVGDVLASDKQIRIQPVSGTRVHYFVADKKGGCAVIEFLNGQMVAHTADSLPVRAVANSVYGESLDNLKDYQGFGGIRPIDQRAKRQRFLHAAELVRAYGAQTSTSVVEYAFQALDAVAQGSHTKWSIVYEPTKSTINFRTRDARSVRSIHLARLDFSPDTPVKILDIDKDLDGDVTAEFVDYTLQRNRDLIRRCFSKTGMLQGFPKILLELIAMYPDVCQQELEAADFGQ